MGALDLGKPGVVAEGGGASALSYATTPQTDVSRCLVCGRTDTRDEPFLPVLTPTRGKHHWLHRDCHEIHAARCAGERRAASERRP